jgi:hypothetical protein
VIRITKIRLIAKQLPNLNSRKMLALKLDPERDLGLLSLHLRTIQRYEAAMMRLELVSIKPDVGRTKSFTACYFLKAMPL